MSLRCIKIALLYFCSFSQLSKQAPLNHDSGKNDKELTFPSVVDFRGNHLSYNLRSPTRHRRNTDNSTELRTYIKIDAFGQSFILNVTQDMKFLHSDTDVPIVEYVNANGVFNTQQSGNRDCYHSGSVHSAETVNNTRKPSGEQWTFVSTCNGLRGVIATLSGYIFVSPLDTQSDKVGDGPWQHTVYKSKGAEAVGTCSSKDTVKALDSIQKTAPSSDHILSRLRRSTVVSELTIETAVVADRSMLEQYGHENLEAFLYTVMGVVHHLYRDPSIGHSFSISLVRTIILEDNEDFSSTNQMLDNFCSWQRTHIHGGPHFDMAVLITRRDICESSGRNCGALGMADIDSVCSKERNCNVNKDTGLSTAFTIAHELGHNLGLRHDGDPQVRCLSNSRYLMAPTFAESLSPHMWSSCSREQLINLISDQGRVSCLLNKPGSVQYDFLGSPIMYGIGHTPTEQCRLQSGNNHTEHCPGMPNECRYLWCRSSTSSSECTHQHSPPPPGTACTLTTGKEGVCYQGACHEYSSVNKPQDGGWSQWTEWTTCSRSCGMGVQYSERKCNSPVPAYGGEWCSGPSRQYQVCNLHHCPSGVGFRDTICQENSPASDLGNWTSASLAVIQYQQLEMCHSHCMSADKRNVLYSIMEDLPDGAPCLTAQSRGVCVQGRCKPVGCDGVLGVDSYKDKCGVWCGQGDSCVRVSGIFKSITHPGTTYYYEAMSIPKGSANIRVEEVTPSPNFIAIDGVRYKKLQFVKILRTDGVYTMFNPGQSSWTYNLSHTAYEVFTTEGPVNDGVMIYAYASLSYNGIRYSFSLPKSKISALRHPVHYWQQGQWGKCIADCAWGIRNRTIDCVQLAANKSNELVVDSSLCDPASKPETEEDCYTVDCVYKWMVGGWNDCSAVCGDGHQNREVSCEWTKLDGDKELVNNSLCEPTNKPSTMQSCNVSCVYEWVSSEWSECDAFCGNGNRTRTVDCIWLKKDGTTETVSDTFCTSEPKPNSRQHCHLTDCVYRWQTTPWTECSVECGPGLQRRSVHCEWNKGSLGRQTVSDSFCSTESDKPSTRQDCNLGECMYTWSTADWNDCSVNICGAGQQNRTVTCEWIRRNGDRINVLEDHCESLKPLASQDCYIECVYMWVVESWGRCDTECGQGSQERTLHCQWNKGLFGNEIVSHTRCNHTLRPPTTRMCRVEECVYTWTVSNWDTCQVDYCGSGAQSRTVTCSWEKRDGTLQTVSNRLCSNEPKPASSQDCHIDCTYEWAVSEWGNCIGLCGEGEQQREISCQWVKSQTLRERVSDSLCVSESPPAASRSCQLQECRYTWVTGQWEECDAGCGTGQRRRTIFCTIESEEAVGMEMCESDTRPSDVEPCFAPQACPEWHVGEWSQCSQCDISGKQTRVVECLDPNGATVDLTSCLADDRPPTERVCLEACPTKPPCVDEYSKHWCNFFLQLNLCSSYKDHCCNTCP